MRVLPRRLRWFVVPVVVGCLFAAAVPSRAEDPVVELKRAQERLNAIQASQKDVQGELNQVFWQHEEAEATLRVVGQELAVAEARLAEINGQLKTTQAELSRVEAQLKAAEQRQQEQQALFDARLRSIQQHGRVSYIGVLLGSHSFSEAINRMDMLKRVVSQDKVLLEELQAAKQAVAEQRDAVATRKQKLAQLQGDAEAQRQTASAKVAERKRVSDTLAQREVELERQLAAVRRESEAAEAAIWELQRRMSRAAGNFAPIRPLRGYHEITSEFGYRMAPIYGAGNNHGGTDFAAGSGESIYAIEDGTVLAASWDTVYGNRVIIDHGGGVASLYGHASQMLVKQGDEVRQGQLIARVGSTGLSTGPHLHLEIRVNGVKQDPMDYLER